jgi:hypothetical protein
MSKMILLIPVSWLGGLMAVSQTITVQLYNRAGARPGVVTKAEQEASRAFERAGIATRWVECPTVDQGRGENQVCEESYAPSRFTIVIDEGFANVRIKDAALGFACPTSGDRNQAAVVYSRLEKVADANRELLNRGSLLGAVLAHEIGHLLLGSKRHGAGLMQASWAEPEFERIAQRRFLFTPEQAAALLTGLRSRYAVAGAPTNRGS